jgi:hypothetical protein
MTIAIAWTRRILNCEELVFVSDSRLSKDGRIFDAAPKALTLSRNDCAIAFAGLTQDAFPMMLQFGLAISSYRVAQRRSMDLSELKTHGLKIFDAMAALFKSDAHVIGAPPDDIPAVEFLFGGYSWIKKEFELWRIKFDKTRKRFVAVEAQWAYFDPLRRRVHMDQLARSERVTAIGRIAFAGDQAPKAKRLFSQMLARRYREGEDISKIDMETVRYLDWDASRQGALAYNRRSSATHQGLSVHASRFVSDLLAGQTIGTIFSSRQTLSGIRSSIGFEGVSLASSVSPTPP